MTFFVVGISYVHQCGLVCYNMCEEQGKIDLLGVLVNNIIEDEVEACGDKGEKESVASTEINFNLDHFIKDICEDVKSNPLLIPASEDMVVFFNFIWIIKCNTPLCNIRWV